MISKGLSINLLTPFTETNEIDFESIERQIEVYIANGAKSLILGRPFGEFLTMNDDEIIDVAEFVVKKVDKRVPVVAQTGFNDTIRSIKLSLRVKNAGVDALILLAPYYSLGNESGILNHFKSIATAVGLPCYIENDSEKTGVDISEHIALLSEIKNIVGIIENTDDTRKYISIISKVSNNFQIVCANDRAIFPALSLGVKSFISPISNICPSDISEIIDFYEKSDIEKSRNKFLSMLEYFDVFSQEVQPVPIKTAMNMLGYDVGDFRLPLSGMNTDYAARVATLIMDQNIRKL